MSDEIFPSMNTRHTRSQPSNQSLHPTPQCEVFEPTLALLALGGTDPTSAETLDVREHLVGCAWCQRRLREYTATRDALGRLGRDDMRAAVLADGAASTPLARHGERRPGPQAALTTLDMERIMQLSEERAR